jgi:hypothetical protein
MKTTSIIKGEKNPKTKEERDLIKIEKCVAALAKGYKYDRATGEIIGRRNKAIKANVHGYTIISFVHDGKRKYLYATTFIEYILKNENESISLEDIELAKAYVKPSKESLLRIKTLKQAKKQKDLIVNSVQVVVVDRPKWNPTLNKSESRKHSKRQKRNRRQKRFAA